MFINISARVLLFVFFKLTIFSLLILQMYQLAKEYLVPFLMKKIEQLEEHFKALLQKKRLLGRTKNRLKKDIVTQEDNLSALEEKISYWHESLAARKKRREEKRSELDKKMREKKDRQGRYIALRALEKKVFPAALFEAENELEEKYCCKEGEDLMNRIVRSLKREDG